MSYRLGAMTMESDFSLILLLAWCAHTSDMSSSSQIVRPLCTGGKAASTCMQSAPVSHWAIRSCAVPEKSFDGSWRNQSLIMLAITWASSCNLAGSTPDAPPGASSPPAPPQERGRAGAGPCVGVKTPSVPSSCSVVEQWLISSRSAAHTLASPLSRKRPSSSRPSCRLRSVAARSSRITGIGSSSAPTWIMRDSQCSGATPNCGLHFFTLNGTPISERSLSFTPSERFAGTRWWYSSGTSAWCTISWAQPWGTTFSHISGSPMSPPVSGSRFTLSPFLTFEGDAPRSRSAPSQDSWSGVLR
mmetsp:Transcript_13998/g.23911  ORF Transcript_13998/g.23911 Transcript_13998/m.23911 type:complete len:302 (-) Transcript_13998:307-1212(-)